MEHTSFRSSTSLVTIRLPLIFRLVLAVVITGYTLHRTSGMSVSVDQLVHSGAFVPVAISLVVTLLAVGVIVTRTIVSRR